jgi:hypothetical protein
MNIAAIKQLADRSPVERVSGTITKVWAPTEQNDNDRKNGRHRQNIYIKDETGEITVTLTQAEQHILDSVDGKTLILSATRNEAGDNRGLLWETWTKGDGTIAGCVKAYHQASIRIENEGASVATGVRQAESPPPQRQQSLPLQGEPAAAGKLDDQFTRHLNECSEKYRRCFVSARQIGSEFNLDMERTQGIATTLFIECKGRELTKTSFAQSLQSPPEGASIPGRQLLQHTQEPAPIPGRKWGAKDNEWLFQKLANGSLQRSKLPKNAVDVLDEVWDEVEERAKTDEMVWADAYRVLCRLITTVHSKHDATSKNTSNVESEWRATIPASQGNLFRLIFADAEKFLTAVENDSMSDNDIPM